MAKNIKRTILSEKSPRNRHIAWAEPKGENIQLNIFNNGKWRPVGGGNSSSDSSGCGCYDVVVKGIKEGDATNYTVEKGNFEEVYNGILSGKMYSFKIVEFQSISEGDIHGYKVNYSYPQKVGIVNPSKQEILIPIIDYTLVWTPEGISVEETEGK